MPDLLTLCGRLNESGVKCEESCGSGCTQGEG